jgi:transcriptional regulator with XRE-family HTH domain
MSKRSTIEELEADLGEQLRAERLRSNLRQADLAKSAGISINTLRRLEAGDGSSVTALISVVKALGREAWLASFRPPVTISPLQMLKSTKTRQRAAGTRGSNPEESA